MRPSAAQARRAWHEQRATNTRTGTPIEVESARSRRGRVCSAPWSRVVTVLPRGPVIEARTGSSPGSGPRRPAFPTLRSVACVGARTAARYSGGAAPALHRLPYPRSRRVVAVKLCGTRSAGKLGGESRLERGTFGVVLRAGERGIVRFVPCVERSDRGSERGDAFFG